MTVKEFASYFNLLNREGKGNLNVYFSDGPISYPILIIEEGELLIRVSDEAFNKAIIMRWKK